MKKAQDYRNHAEECRALARRSRTEEERLQLLTMAATWDGLAAEREQQIESGYPVGPGSETQASSRPSH